MRILHIITLSELGGAQSVVTNLIKSQSKENEVHIISGGNGESWKNLNSTTVHLIKELKRNISLQDLIVLQKLIKLKKSICPDIIHLHSSKIGILGRVVFNSASLIYTVHGFDTILVANRKFLFLEKLLKNKTNKIIAVSRYDERNLHSVGIEANVACVYNGIEDIATSEDICFDPQIINNIEAIKSKYQFTICCIARDDYPKRVDIFLEIARNIPDAAFIWIGNNKTYSNLDDNVFLFGKVPSAAIYLKYMDLFVLPSDYEGLPMSIIEALSFALPVIASDVGGISELLNSTNGYTVKNTVEDFSSKINKVLSDPVLYESMRKKARETYQNKFTLKIMAENYDRIYNEIISDKR